VIYAVGDFVVTEVDELRALADSVRLDLFDLVRLSLAPAEVVFVDDLADNVSSAAGLGINAVLFTTIDDLRRELAGRFDGAVPLPAAR
jgi:hypothetical protein